MTGKDAVLELTGVSAGYGDAPIVKGVSLKLLAGEILTLIGPNGSGKSTLAKAVAGLVSVHRGEIILGANEITKLAPWERLQQGIAYVPQNANVFPNMSVAENMKIAVENLRPVPADTALRKEKALSLFEELAGKLGQRAGLRSGGERQLLAFSCAVMTGPRVLVLDEPSAGLSPKLTDIIMHKICAIQASGVAILLIEQNVKAAFKIARRVLVLVNGSVAVDATPADFGSKYDLHALYLG